MVQSAAMRPSIRCALPAQSLSRRLPTVWTVFVSCLLLSSCSVFSNLTPIGTGPLGTVALERVVNRGTTAKYSSALQQFHASHPAILSASLISRVLDGLSVSGIDRPGRDRTQDTYPLLSHEEVEFFAPLIATALAQAQPDQQVRFAAHDDGLTTQGTLYLHKTMLRLSLSHYRSSPAQTETLPPSLVLSFSPAQALVQADTPQSWIGMEAERPHVAIAIEALNKFSPSSSSPADNTSPMATEPAQPESATEHARLQQELQSTKDLVVKQAEELQKLREELESARRRLAEKESASSKAKPKTAPRKQPATTPR